MAIAIRSVKYKKIQKTRNFENDKKKTEITVKNWRHTIDRKITKRKNCQLQKQQRENN